MKELITVLGKYRFWTFNALLRVEDVLLKNDNANIKDEKKFLSV